MRDIENWVEPLANENYIPPGRIQYQKNYARKKGIPLNLYRSRSFNFKERVEKRNNVNNNSESRSILKNFLV